MAKETHIKTDKKPVGGWGTWELRFDFLITASFKKIIYQQLILRRSVRFSRSHRAQKLKGRRQ
jgi:hypothetical protein